MDHAVGLRNMECLVLPHIHPPPTTIGRWFVAFLAVALRCAPQATLHSCGKTANGLCHGLAQRSV